MKPISILMVLPLAIMMACGSHNQSKATDATQTEEARAAQSVTFDADSAYAYVAAQTSMGPRVPNTEAHRRCARYLADKLGQLGASDVTVDTCTLRAYDGTQLNAFNITASVNPQANKRILLLSHWDSRPWADNDPDVANHYRPIDGANDGASGVGVILEVVRNTVATRPDVGVDVLLVDAEDYGEHADTKGLTGNEESWALGTQHWVEQPTLDLRRIRYAILLDMVGGKDAVFHREYFSDRYARPINDKVWRVARQSGYGARFVDNVGAPVIDDHIYLYRANIPAIDIIENQNPETGSFNPTWHTVNDNIDNIDRETLRVVGQTLLNLIYAE